MTIDDLVSVPEAAVELGLSRQRVLKLLSENRISGAKRIGARWMIPSPVKRLSVEEVSGGSPGNPYPPGMVTRANFLNGFREQIKSYMKFLDQGNSDSSVVISGVAFLESLMTEVLASLLPGSALWDELTLHQKTELFGAMKLFSPDALGDVRTIRKIRNLIAHPTIKAPPDFQRSDIALLVKKLRFGTYEPAFNDCCHRARFLWVWAAIASTLSAIVGTSRPLDLHRMVMGMDAPTAKHLYVDDA